MQSFSVQDPANHPASPPCPGDIRSAPTNFADEISATVARLFAYVGVLMLFGILGFHAWDRLRIDLAAEPTSAPGWSVADGSSSGSASSARGNSDKLEKPATYETFRHFAGAREVKSGEDATAPASPDWMTDTANPRLRGSL
jgi:hypothetical protein